MPVTAVASPCVRLCVLDDSGAYCTGCRRSLAEITGWSRYSDAERRSVLERLALLRGPADGDQPLPREDGRR